MSERKQVRINKIPENDILLELTELMIYYKMSYPTGQKDECTIQIKEGSNEIITPDSTYKLSDEVFLYVYLLSNRAIANIYKLIRNDQETQD